MSKNVIFITNIKNPENLERSKPYDYAVKSWKHFADKNDCRLFVLDQYLYETDYMKPNWYKTYVFDLLDGNDIEYDQIAIVDADTMVHPECPNFFEMSENKFCAIPAEGSCDWICRSIENYSKYLFSGFSFPFWEYFNSGFLIVNKEHKSLYDMIKNFFIQNRDNIVNIQNTFMVGTDQPVINFFVQIENIDYKLFPYEFNMQDLPRKEILTNDLLFTKLGWMYHFNAIPDNHNADKTLYWMEKTYKYFHGND